MSIMFVGRRKRHNTTLTHEQVPKGKMNNSNKSYTAIVVTPT